MLLATPAVAQHHQNASPNTRTILDQVITGMPKGDRQQVRIMLGNIRPGGKTPLHSHRFPVAVHVLEGTFTLELEGQGTVVLRAGESLIEPPNVRMTGYNRSENEYARTLIFYASDPDTPFSDVVN